MDLSWIGLFGAGLATFVSPCVLPLMPILVASWATAGAPRFSRMLATAWFALGFTLTFVAMGAGASLISGVLLAWKPVLLAVGALILGVFGLRMMGVISLGWLERSFHAPDISRRFPRGLSGLVFGLIFGLSWTPCVGPVLGAVLTYVAAQQASPARGALMLFVFAQGIALPLLLLSAGFERVRPGLARLKAWLPRIEYATGMGLVIFAALMINAARFSAKPDEAGAVMAVDHHGERFELGAGAAVATRMHFFYTQSCPICHAMEPFLPGLERDCASEAFRFSRIDVGAPENAAIADRFKVRAVPTVSLLAPDGSELLRLVGYQTEGRLRDAARSTAGLLCARTERGEALPAPDLKQEQACSVGKAC
ncbi:MAG: thioredoxin domain-containing protein [Oligoflexia bacterium]|nr:thioredoxin domain-containing protein [Oligoflexia bacterium]